MKRFFEILGVATAATLSATILIHGTSDENTDPEYRSNFMNNYSVYSVPLPTSVQFAGEEVPLEDPDVFERLDREMLVNTYWQSNGILLIKRANKYFPVIEPILKKNGIPDDFKYLAVIESGLTNAASPAGARGFWQFLEGTARDYDLEVNGEVDERYHVALSTEAACKYFKDAYERFGSWTLVAASYNMGMFGLEKQLDRQHETSYYNVNLNEETGRYVFRILAIKQILANYKDYGFKLREKDLYKDVPTYEITVDTTIAHLGDFAHQNNISYKTLKYLNPWLRDNSLNNRSGKPYLIKLPKEGYYQLYKPREEEKN
ncbi:MAG: lytic transglycosylase domain-containing protein [Bacteroidota bacterium]|nr:lytic transglycosylase domain-containing protein [Bacteroidota bacterium]MDX5449380.1 lytic transglycosylase domain-containing protein [Bacteroidota bacterium]MDX5504832.1 lytic transglycosylase domain-containing protein [Bacteroidota bacterium]